MANLCNIADWSAVAGRLCCRLHTKEAKQMGQECRGNAEYAMGVSPTAMAISSC